jgi:FkbM family methyltransferase
MRKFLRWLSALAPTRGLVRWLGLTPLMRRAYHRWVAPDNIFRAELAGIPIMLYAKTGRELLWLEAAVTTGREWSERHALEAMLSFLNPGNIAYDVGANFGLYSVALAKRVGDVGKIIAFEPRRSTFELLQANIELNNLKNIRCFQKALGEQVAKLPMYTYPEEPWCSSLVERQDKTSGGSAGVESVEVEVGDSFRKAYDLPMPRAIKIDVEGFEYSVMRGLGETLGDPRCQFVGCEMHPHLLPPGITPQHVMDLLRSYGFNRIELSPSGLDQKIDCYKA